MLMLLQLTPPSMAQCAHTIPPGNPCNFSIPPTALPPPPPLSFLTRRYDCTGKRIAYTGSGWNSYDLFDDAGQKIWTRSAFVLQAGTTLC